MGFIQRAFAERPGIQTSAGDVEVGVERAIRLHLNRQTDALEPVNHNAATGQQFLTTSFAFRQAFRREAGERRMLRGRVGAQVVVGGQIVNRFQHSGSSGRIAQPRRQPVMPKNLEKLLHTMASGSQASTDLTSVPSGSRSAKSR